LNRTTIAALAAATALALPAANAVAALQAPANVQAKKKVVSASVTVTGSSAETGRWGPLQVQLIVTKTTTVGTKKTVKYKIKNLRVPVYPDHTDRSVFINEQALPMLAQEVLQAQSANIQMISGATDTSYAFAQSLQSALLQIKKA
jgi:uncharacterized protein with FMN-binding domain